MSSIISEVSTKPGQAHGENIAGLYSLTATCDANGVNPLAYLTDVLGRIGSHPQSRLDELLPHLWRPPDQPVTPPSPA